MNAVARAIRSAAERLEKVAGVPVDYRRNRRKFSITAVPTIYKKENQDFIQGRASGKELRDFLIIADRLPVVPGKGDRIVWGKTVYELVSPSDEEKVFRYADAYKTVLRVHTQEL